MTVATTLNVKRYTGNGATTAFAFPYRFDAQSDLIVAAYTTATGVLVDTYVLNTDYTISGTVTNGKYLSGGTVTMTVAPLATTTLVILRSIPATQESDYGVSDPFSPDTLEGDFDKLTMLVQQLEEQLGRSIKISESSSLSSDALAVTPEASKFLAWNAAADQLVNAEISGTTAIINAGSLKVKTYIAGTDYTAGTTDSLTLTGEPVSEANTFISFDGVQQHRDTYSVSGTTITFTSPIPTGVASVEATVIVPNSIAPSDGTVGTDTILDGAVTLTKMADMATDSFIGRDTAGTGVPEVLSAATARTILNVEDGADVTDTTNVAAAGAVMESDYTPSHSILVQQSGTGSPTALSIGNNTLVGRLSGGGSDINDLSVSDVRTLLNVEDGADVTDTTNVTAAGALMDSEVSSLSGIKTLTVPDSTTITAAAATVLDDATVAAMVDTLGGASSTGSGGLVRATSPTLTTPNIGAATGASLNLTGSLEVSSASPYYTWSETDQAVDGKNWLMLAAAGSLRLATATDAAPSTGVENALRIYRTGTSVTEVEINATTIDVNATADFSGLVTASAGITFGETTLANYQQSSYTPVIYGASTAGTPTYTTQAGYFTRIGNVVFGNIFITLNTSLGGLSGNVRITLPSTASVAGGSVTIGACSGYSVAAGKSITADINPSTNYIRLRQADENDTSTNLTDSNITTSLVLELGIMYFV